LTHQTYFNLTTELRNILFRERELLRAGYPVETLTLVERKSDIMRQLEPLIAAWEKGDVEQGEIQQLKEISSLALENKERFNAVRNGLNSLIERLSEHGSGTRIGAYDQSGQQRKFERSTGSYKKSI